MLFLGIVALLPTVCAVRREGNVSSRVCSYLIMHRDRVPTPYSPGKNWPGRKTPALLAYGKNLLGKRTHPPPSSVSLQTMRLSYRGRGRYKLENPCRQCFEFSVSVSSLPYRVAHRTSRTVSDSLREKPNWVSPAIFFATSCTRFVSGTHGQARSFGEGEEAASVLDW